MASGGLRAAYLSASTEADAGYKASNTHFPRHWLYAMLNLTSLAFGGFWATENQYL